MSAIQINSLNKSYNKHLVLKNLSLDIKKGEVYGFIGMNGAGKTTTINLIMSLIQKDSGEINILDETIEYTNQAYKSHIGFVPDVPMFPKHMNAKEYLKYTLELFGKVYDKQLIQSTLDFVSLGTTNKRIHTYSRGMKQRLAIAQALIHDPEILIMDEPTSALDPKGRKDVMDIIKELKGNKTIFYSTHILDDVEKVCDRIGILHQGELVLEDTIGNLQSKFSSNEYKVLIDNDFGDEASYIDEKIYESIAQNENVITIKLKEDIKSSDLISELARLKLEVKALKQQNKSIEEIFIEETK